MRLTTIIISILFIACNGSKKQPSSFWEQQKGNFKYHNKKEFLSDSLLIAEYKSLKQSSDSLFEDLHSNHVYLYSWQERDKTKNEFTVIKDAGELGLKIFYFIVDKNDSLLSWTQIASRGGEAGVSFETSSRFISRDTMLNIGAITQAYDFKRQQNMDKPKGDSTFSHYVIDKNGKITERVFKEIKELGFEEEN
jgi:hypothetical protein